MIKWLKDTKLAPNILSTLRLAASWIPLWILVATPADDLRWRLAALGVFTCIVLTDMLDGHLARKWKQVSSYGKVVDPLADKALVILTLIGLCLTNSLASPLGWILLGAIFWHEACVTFIRILKKRKLGLVVAAGGSGKIKMFLQSLGVVVAFLPFSATKIVAWILLLGAMPFAMKALSDYASAEGEKMNAED